MEKKLTQTLATSKEKQLASLSYMWIFSVLVLLSKRESIFIQHHARRGSVLFILSIVFWLVPYLKLAEFLVIALMIFGFVVAAQGDENLTPVLSELADGTLRLKHLKNYWHNTKGGVVSIVKPDYVSPQVTSSLKEQGQELNEQEKTLQAEKKLLDQEEKKLSSLLNRVNEDEKKIEGLSEEVRNLEKEVKEMKGRQ